MIASLPPEQACKMFSCAPSQRGSAIFRHRYIASGYAPREDLERVTRLELATSSLARRCSTTELHPQSTYEKRPHKKPKNLLVRLFYPAYIQDQVITRQSVFQKVG